MPEAHCRTGLASCNVPERSPSCSRSLRSAMRHFNRTVCASQWPRARSRTSAISTMSDGTPTRASTSRNYPMMWGGSPKVQYEKIDQRYMNIDGDAGTAMYRFGGQIDEVAFLKNDITNLAYYIRNRGRSAVIGVGGGR